jgi:hypothetical protein
MKFSNPVTYLLVLVFVFKKIKETKEKMLEETGKDFCPILIR